MIKRPLNLVWVVFLGILLSAGPAISCSTFMLSRDRFLVVGHNLDQSFYTPGVIHVNRRAEKKRSISGVDLQLTDTETPVLEWTSKYGSVTFSLLGRNLPDGGMNEAGLTVSEMGLGGSVFPFDNSLPTMFSHLWIQYQLDNFDTVDEVLEHLPEINIEPSSTFSPPASANYHLLITDSSGNIAVIEFLEGGLRVYKNEEVPVPALCNRTYQQDLDTLESYQGFLGWTKRQLNSKDDLRFVKCAAALRDFESIDDGEPVEFAFSVLAQMQFDRTKQWSVVYNVPERRVWFRTAKGPLIRYLDFKSLDFSADAQEKILEDIDVNRLGDVSGHFVDFSREADRSVIDKFLRSLVRFVSKTDDAGVMDAYMLDHYGFEVKDYVDRALGATELIRCETP